MMLATTLVTPSPGSSFRLMKLLRLALVAGVCLARFCASAHAETFKIDPAHSTIGFQVHQFFGTTKGKFSHFSGTIELLKPTGEI
jgi:polyisoprenoid-binding protein YceI